MDNRLDKFIKFILIVLILLVSSLHLLREIRDSDFFWHLKAGEWIWQNKSLPSENPFTYTTPPSHTGWERFVLTSSWLSEVIYYLFYLADGMSGIVILRFVITGILTYIMLKRKQGDSILYIGLFLFFLIEFLEESSLDRPQAFSFLFFAALLFIMEKIKDAETGRGRTIYFLLPLFMLVWANMHGGHAIGQVTIVFYILTEGIKFFHPSLRPMEKKIYKRLLIAGVTGIVFSFANPNLYHTVATVISVPANMAADIIEYQSSLNKFKTSYDYNMLLYWFILLLTIIGLIINIKKTDITEAALLAGTGYFSFTTIRYIPFFMITALPVVGRLFSTKGILKWSRILMLLIVVYIAIFFTWDERSNINRIATGRWTNNYAAPENAVEFILKNNIKGNMYNYYNYGGYLIWRLVPERKVFIYGGNTNEQIHIHSMLINDANEQDVSGLPAWKYILEAYNVSYIVIPLFESSGRKLPLINSLLRDGDWIPVFFNLNSLIFVKNLPGNYHVINTYAIHKDYLIANIP
ncbi:MAG: hypothetical protein HY754_14365 [Nitrospirae bacterium]|nr:hypothetical protein [Nitrospirota bacterium]